MAHILLLKVFFFVVTVLSILEISHAEEQANGVTLIEVPNDIMLSGYYENCSHKNKSWTCCVGFEAKLNFSTCISIQYLPQPEYGLELKVTFNGLVIFNRRVSARNPPPICFGVPHLEVIADACFKFHDLEEDENKLRGCVLFEGIIGMSVEVFKFEIGCFEIPLIFIENEVNRINQQGESFLLKDDMLTGLGRGTPITPDN